MKRLFFLILPVIFCSFSCSPGDNSKGIFIDGSSTVYPITNAILLDYGIENDINDYSLSYSGSSSGIEQLCNGKIHIANSSRPIKQKEQELCKSNQVSFVEIPIAKDGIAIVVNSGNNWVDYFTLSELKNLWMLSAEDKVAQWNDIRRDWPRENVSLFGPTSTSGTYDFFFETLFGEEIPPRGDYVSSEDDSYLGRAIAEDENGIGFFGLAYYKSELFSLKLIPVDDEIEENGDGPVSPSELSVLNNTYSPFSRSLFLYVSEEALQNQELINFLEYYMLHVSEIVSEVGYIPEDGTV